MIFATKALDSPARTQSGITLQVCGRAFLFIFLFVSAGLKAQYKYEAVFPSLSEQDLYEAVRLEFTPDTLLDYGVARDTLFLRIDAVDRFLSCIYTGMTLYIPEGQDPTQAVFLNGIADGINTEHVYPQGFGLNDQPAQGDMHNLYPSRVKTNNDRANRPFGESPDQSTERWYLDKTEMTSKPSSMIDAYSELGSAGQFEPRESVKGDIARSMFYIYTIYRELVEPEDPNYFPLQVATLCQWHQADPVDEKEWNRSMKIAAYQSGKANPFVLDCSLASRIYCNGVSPACALLAPKETEVSHAEMTYDVSQGVLYAHDEDIRSVYILDVFGRHRIGCADDCAVMDLSGLESGLYFAVAAGIDGGKIGTMKMVVLR